VAFIPFLAGECGQSRHGITEEAPIVLPPQVCVEFRAPQQDCDEPTLTVHLAGSQVSKELFDLVMQYSSFHKDADRSDKVNALSVDRDAQTAGGTPHARLQRGSSLQPACFTNAHAACAFRRRSYSMTSSPGWTPASCASSPPQRTPSSCGPSWTSPLRP
jgi:hypothetical protein